MQTNILKFNKCNNTSPSTMYNNKNKERCKCCLEETQLRDLWCRYEIDGVCEIYGDMLIECFALSWEQPSDENSEHICGSCVKRLQDAVSFKKEILCSQQLLLEKIKEERFKEETESDAEVTNEFFIVQSVPENYEYVDYEHSTSIKTEASSKPEPKTKKSYSKEELAKCIDAIMKDNISQSKASIMFKIPKRAISQALNPKYPEKPNKSENAEKVKTYTADQLRECIEAVKSGKYSQTKAAAFYNIPRTTIGRAVRRQERSSDFRKEVAIKKKCTEDDLKDCLDAVRNNVFLREKASELYKISCNFRKKLKTTHPEISTKLENAEKVKTYTEDQLRECLEAVRNGLYSQSKAAAFYNIPKTTVNRAFKRQECLSNTEKEVSVKKRITEDELKECLEAVRNNLMTREKASRFYGISCKTIRKKLLNLQPNEISAAQMEYKKYEENIVSILLNTNATPIKRYNDFGYNCSFCPKAFQIPTNLKEHTISEHSEKEKNEFVKGKWMRNYIIKLDITGLKCDLCNDNIDSLEEIMKHLAAHGQKMHFDINNNIVPYKFDGPELSCTTCGTVFLTFKLLMEHMNRHSKNFVCDICGSGYVTRTTFSLHRASHNKGVFPCKYCPKIFETRITQLTHEKCVHLLIWKRFICGYCGEKFKSRRTKQLHVSAEHGVKMESVPCRACDKLFPTVNALRIHTKRDHLCERRFGCKICDKKFFSNGLLRSHMLKHSGLRKYQCDICKKSYGRLFTLSQHMRIHLDDRRFKCEHCKLAFVQKCSWRAHVRAKHGEIE